MPSYKLIQKLHGCDEDLFVCSCGHQMFVKNKFNEEAIVCPNCKDKTLYYINKMHLLAFGQIPIEGIVVEFMQDEDKPYNIKIDIIVLKNAYKMDFENKRVILLNEKYDNYLYKHFRIDFDGYSYKNDAIKYTDLIVNKSYTDEEFFSQIKKISPQIKDTFSLNKKIICNNNTQLGVDIRTIFSKGLVFDKAIELIMAKLMKIEKECKNFEKIIKIGVNYENIQGFINKKGNSLEEMLGISSFAIKNFRPYLKDYLLEIQEIEKIFGKYSNYYLKNFALKDKFNKRNYRHIFEMIDETNISISELYKYVYEKAPLKQGLYDAFDTLKMLYDTFNMSRALNVDFTLPKSLLRTHNSLIKEYNLIKEKANQELFHKIIKKNKSIEYEDSNYAIMLPSSPQDLVQEGINMHHCVGSYVSRIIQQDCLVVYLRRKSNKDFSYVTIEISDNNIQQIKGKNNSSIKNKEVLNFIRQWAKEKRIENRFNLF